jgi:hypothetical protein
MMRLALAAVSALMVARTSTNSVADFDDRALIAQIAHGMNTTDMAVACGQRTNDWRKSVLVGYRVQARLAMATEHQNATDEEVEALASKIFRAAKLKASRDAQSAAPDQLQCSALNGSSDMTNMDDAAKLGQIFGVIRDEN